MAKVFTGRYSADVEGDFVVFLIGMRINKPWDVRGWWHTFVVDAPDDQGARGEPRARPDLGAPGWFGGPAVVQYWRSLRAARPLRAQRGPAATSPRGRSGTRPRGRPARSASGTRPTRCARASTRSIYGNMPRHGLATATAHVPVTAKGRSAARRIGATTGGRARRRLPRRLTRELPARPGHFGGP